MYTTLFLVLLSLHFPSYIPQNGLTALWTACFEGHPKIVELLINAGAALDVQEEVC